MTDREDLDAIPHHDVHADVGAAPPVRPASTRTMMRIGIGVAVLLVLFLAAGIIPRRATQHELQADVAAMDSAPAVLVTTVRRAAPGSELMLPGTIQALHESAIYARVSGYVKRWHADIGSVVHGGDVLAEIDAPELEQEVQQAQQQLAQTRAALGLARTDLARWRSLAADSAVTSQELDQKQAAYDAAMASSGAAEANLNRLAEMRRYTRVTAPFTGVVTARNVDLGALITAAGATSASLPSGGAAPEASGSLYRVAQTDTVRTYINVPESYATSITPGLKADVLVQALPGRTFEGRVVRTSRSLDVATRTLLVEVDITNPGFVLLPGMFAQVRLRFSRATPPLLIPASALVIRADGPQVVVIDSASGASGKARFQSVDVARDYGASVEIANGITDGATIVVNPSADLVDGETVRVLADSRKGR